MRFRIECQVWVEVDTIAELVELENAAESAAVEAVSKRAIPEPGTGASSGVVIEGLDEESRIALAQHTDEQWSS